MSAHVTYVLDIGVYLTDSRGQVVRDGTSAGWCRVEGGLADFDVVTHRGNADQGRFMCTSLDRDGFRCGRNIQHLGDAIAEDLRSGRRVALGFEAPMWLPLELEHRADLRLFQARFVAENGFEWYKQSGAAATLKAIGLGTVLRGRINQRLKSPLKSSTEPGPAPEGVVRLFEAFVVGPYKAPVPSGVARARDEWDAMTAALAWNALYEGQPVPDGVDAVLFHPSGSWKGVSMSVWSLVFTKNLIGPRDCAVVGLRRLSKQPIGEQAPASA